MTKPETIAHAVRGSDGTRYVCLGFVEAANKARYLAEQFPSVRFSIVELIERPADEPTCSECARLRNDIQELTCGDPRLVCPNCRPDAQRAPACGELSIWGGTEILSCGLPAGHSGHHEFS